MMPCIYYPRDPTPFEAYSGTGVMVQNSLCAQEILIESNYIELVGYPGSDPPI